METENTTKKLWSINVFSKDNSGTYSKDLYGAKYKWSYDDKTLATKSFENIILSDGKETLCELMEYDFDTCNLTCIDSKYSNHFAGTYIIPAKYQDEIK